jgi:GDPmannose 4,6-dehydratase
VREFCELAFLHADLSLTWHGNGAQEQGIDTNGRVRVEIDSRYFRPTEVDMLRGDSTKAQTEIGWKPVVDFSGLVRSMVDADESLAKSEKTLANAAAI